MHIVTYYSVTYLAQPKNATGKQLIALKSDIHLNHFITLKINGGTRGMVHTVWWRWIFPGLMNSTTSISDDEEGDTAEEQTIFKPLD